MHYLYSFLFVGVLCAICQIILDKTRFTPGHITSALVFIGCFLQLGHVYDWLLEHVGVGVVVPITSFGHLLAEGALTNANPNNLLSLFTGMLTPVSAGISFAVIIAFFTGVLCNAKD